MQIVQMGWAVNFFVMGFVDIKWAKNLLHSLQGLIKGNESNENKRKKMQAIHDRTKKVLKTIHDNALSGAIIQVQTAKHTTIHIHTHTHNSPSSYSGRICAR